MERRFGALRPQDRFLVLCARSDCVIIIKLFCTIDFVLHSCTHSHSPRVDFVLQNLIHIFAFCHCAHRRSAITKGILARLWAAQRKQLRNRQSALFCHIADVPVAVCSFIFCLVIALCAIVGGFVRHGFIGKPQTCGKLITLF